MERLTSKCDIEGFENWICVSGKAFGRAYFESEEDYKNVTEAFEKLAAYEDTGHEPEEVALMVRREEWEPMIKITSVYGVQLDRLHDLACAESEGRLIIFPCKVGDTIYRPVKEKNEIWEWQIVEARYYGDGGFYNSKIEFVDDSENYFFEDELGKTVFLTREEAEKELEGMK